MRINHLSRNGFLQGTVLLLVLLLQNFTARAQGSCCDIENFADFAPTVSGLNCLQQTSGPDPNTIYATGRSCKGGPAVEFNFPTCSGGTVVSVDYGDGSTVQTSFPASHSFTATGTFTITISTSIESGCEQHFSIVVYIANSCCPNAQQFHIDVTSPTGDLCAGHPITFSIALTCDCVVDDALANAEWTFADGTVLTGASVQQTFAAGSYSVSVSFTPPGCETVTLTQTGIRLENCAEPSSCTTCIGSFAPEPGVYIASVWVRETMPVNPYNYAAAEMQISFTGAPTASVSITASTSSRIIDGWQRLEGQVTVPAGASQIVIDLKNNSIDDDNKVYFDDIRIHPFDSNMKTYVYDPVTLRLVAELDERNYATLYEYDEEGILIRVKKETEKGIMTIKETRQNNSK